MARLGVVTCQILELEFAHILSSDPEVSEIWVMDDEFSQELTQTLEAHHNIPVHRMKPESVLETDNTTRGVVMVRVMEVGLHSNISVLKQEVTKAVREIGSKAGAVLLGYGLCGNAFDNLNALFKEIPVPVLLPMDKDGPVDDCVGLIIGGRENYYAEQCRCAGTMFMNAGFSRYWKKILPFDVPSKLAHKKDDILKRLMGSYTRSLLLPTVVMGEDALRENTREFSRHFGLKTDTQMGTLSLLKTAWSHAKKAAGW